MLQKLPKFKSPKFTSSKFKLPKFKRHLAIQNSPRVQGFKNLLMYGSPVLFDRYIRFVFCMSGGMIASVLVSTLFRPVVYVRLLNQWLNFFGVTPNYSQSSIVTSCICLLILLIFFAWLAQPLYVKNSILFSKESQSDDQIDWNDWNDEMDKMQLRSNAQEQAQSDRSLK